MSNFIQSPFWPGSGGGGTPSSPFRILSFTNNRTANEIGTTVDNVTFNWSYMAGPATSQAIMPLPGVVNPPSALTTTLSGVDIISDTMFTLQASDGQANRSATTWLRFFYPMFVGLVDSELPVESEIFAMERRVRPTENFRQNFVIDDQRIAIAVHNSLPRPRVFETIFGLEVTGSFNVYNGVYLNTPAGLQSFTVLIFATLQNTIGLDMPMDFRF